MKRTSLFIRLTTGQTTAHGAETSTPSRRALRWLVIAAIILFGANVARAYDPSAIKIYTWTDLNNIRNDMSGSYVLMNDLTELSLGYTDTAIFDPTKGWTPIGTSRTWFTGVLDGDGHTISGLWFNRPGAENQGLFGVIIDGTVKNLGVNIAAAGIRGNQRVGGLVGHASNVTISDCYVTGGVSGDSIVGGLLGIAVNGTTIADCYTTGDVNGISFVGGLLGIVASGTTIADCYTTGDVSGKTHVGGLVGDLSCGAITDSFALNSSLTNLGFVGLEGMPCGRIVGSHFRDATLSNNFALATMAVTTNGAAYTPVPGHNLRDGEDISTTEAVSRAAYKAAGRDFVNTWMDAPPYNDGTPTGQFLTAPSVNFIYPLSGSFTEPDRDDIYAQWKEITSPDETWVHIDGIRVSPGGDVMLTWAYAPVTNLLRTASYTYAYFVSTDLVDWKEALSPFETRDVGGTHDEAILYNTNLPPSNRRFFKVKAVKN